MKNVSTSHLELSLIVTTFNRENELKRFLDSIVVQEVQKFEVILVNQGVISENIRDIFKKFNWTVIDTGSQIPLSIARNIGLTHHKGKYIGFPDDDCWYPLNFINDLLNVLENLIEFEALCVSVFDPILNKSYGNRPKNIIKELNFSNIIKLPVSVGIFIKSKVVNELDLIFNEKLGAGTYYGGGEETAFLCSVLKNKKKILYNGFLSVYHETDNYNLISIEKIKKYSIGYGYLVGAILRIGKLQVLPSIFVFLFKSFAGMTLRCYKRRYILIYYNRIKYFFLGINDSFREKKPVF